MPGMFITLLTARKKTWIALAVFLLANIAFALYMRNWQRPSLEVLAAEWNQKRKLLAGSGSLGSIYRQGEADLAAFRGRMPVKKDFARVVGDLLEIAANNGLKTGGITYKPDILEEDKAIRYSITLNVSGNYAAIKSFIADVQRYREILAIEHVSLNSGTDAEVEGVNLRVSLAAYFRMEGT